jgi:crotonobetainyl-CoA:carnitine CoA-transferase CaiB-like acyl-CoA transferase
MDEEGLGDEYLDSVDWENMGYGQVRAEVMARVVEPLQRFFLTKTREELVQASIERRILLFPVATQSDILSHPHLEARDYFRQVPHPELDDVVTYPGMFVKDREGFRLGLRRRPPLIGEHNLEIYQGELGLAPEELATLKEGRAI